TRTATRQLGLLVSSHEAGTVEPAPRRPVADRRESERLGYRRGLYHGATIAPETVRHREVVAWTSRKQGRTQGQIAEELGISQPAVSKILRRVDRRTLKRLERDVKLVKVKQAERLDELYQEAMWAWNDSKE